MEGSDKTTLSLYFDHQINFILVAIITIICGNYSSYSIFALRQ